MPSKQGTEWEVGIEKGNVEHVQPFSKIRKGVVSPVTLTTVTIAMKQLLKEVRHLLGGGFASEEIEHHSIAINILCVPIMEVASQNLNSNQQNVSKCSTVT